MICEMTTFCDESLILACLQEIVDLSEAILLFYCERK